ncbi:MAG: multiheme c-type cytochrome [Candidatus Aquicultor sp.]
MAGKSIKNAVIAVSLLIILTLSVTSCGKNTTAATDSNLSQSFNQLQSSQFIGSNVCMTCHSELHRQWSGSMHNNSFKDPLFQKVYEQAVKDTRGDSAIEAFCVACHNPIGFTSGEIPPSDGSKLSEIAKNGVQCDFCHTITRSKGIGDFAMINDPGEVKRGPFKDSDFHETGYSKLHTKGEFCGMCHSVNHPNNNLVIENTYEEWKKSPYRALGVQCQDCHMTPGPGVTKLNPGKASMMGPDRPHIYTHSITGGNVAITSALGASEHAQLAEERLKAAAKIKVFAPRSIHPGSRSSLKVKVTNIGAGHFLPTGLTQTRQMWLFITVKDSQDIVVFSSGDLDTNGSIMKGAVIFNTVLADASGGATDKLWAAEEILYDHRIPPKKSTIENYSFKVPADALGPFEIKAVLKYRSAPQALVNELLGEDNLDLPIIDMTGESVTVK